MHLLEYILQVVQILIIINLISQVLKYITVVILGFFRFHHQSMPENLVINKSGQSSFAGTYGGKYRLNHSTISNFWNSGIRQFPSLLLNNFYIDSDDNEFINNLFDVDITNSIIDGNQNIEFLIEKLGDTNLDYKLSNSLIKFNDINDYFDNNPIYDLTQIIYIMRTYFKIYLLVS